MQLFQVTERPDIAKTEANHWRLRIASPLPDLYGSYAAQMEKEVTEIVNVVADNRGLLSVKAARSPIAVRPRAVSM
jgi:hypothetical protein